MPRSMPYFRRLLPSLFVSDPSSMYVCDMRIKLVAGTPTGSFCVLACAARSAAKDSRLSRGTREMDGRQQ